MSNIMQTRAMILILMVLNLSQSLTATPRGFSLGLDHAMKTPFAPKRWVGMPPTRPVTPSYPQQSPVDIITCQAVLGNLPVLQVKSGCLQTAWTVMTNTGHSVKVSLREDSGCKEPPYAQGGPLDHKFVFQQMHVHWGEYDYWGSEHLINGESYLMEIHLVHFNSKYENFDKAQKQKDGLAVVAVMVKASSKDNPKIDDFISRIPEIRKAGSAVDLDDAGALLWAYRAFNHSHSYYTYNGSLTTEPYSENVKWVILDHPIRLSHNQISPFRTLHDNNGRNITDNKRQVQPLVTRQITYSNKLSST